MVTRSTALSRRSILLAGAAAAVLPAARRLDTRFAFTRSTAVLEDADVGVITGLPGRMLTMAREPSRAPLQVRVHGASGFVRWEDGPEVRLAFRDGGESFVSAWVLPLEARGLLGCDPARDLPQALSCGDGEFWNLPLQGFTLPASLEAARAVCVAFVGALPGLQVLDDFASALSRVVPADTHVLLTATLHEPLEPRALVSILGPACQQS